MSLTKYAQEIGHSPPSTIVENSIQISNTLSKIPTYALPLISTYTQVSTPLNIGLSSLSIAISVPPTLISSSLPSYNVIHFTYSNPLHVPSNPSPKYLHVPSPSYNFRIHLAYLCLLLFF